MGRVRQLSCMLSVLIVIAAGAGPFRVAQTSAQTETPETDDGDRETYKSPTYGYSIPYGDDWHVVVDRSDDDIDTFEITNDVSVVTFTGAAASSDAAECLVAAVDELLHESAFRDFDQAVANGDDPYEGEGALGLYTGYTDGETAVYLECGLNPDATVEVLVRVVVTIDEFSDEIGPINDLLDGIAWKPSAGSRFAGRVTPTTGRATPTEKPDPGTSANRYVDEENGWSLTWDKTWTLESDPEKDGLLDLNKGEITVFIYVISNTTDAHDCLSEKLLSLTEDEKVSNVNLLRRDGAPVRGGDETAAYVAYVYDYESTPDPLRMVDHYECRILPSGEDALLMSHIVRERLYDEEAEAVAKLLEGLTINN